VDIDVSLFSELKPIAKAPKAKTPVAKALADPPAMPDLPKLDNSLDFDSATASDFGRFKNAKK
jgi:hypothetical protein